MSPALRRQRQEDRYFEASLGYIEPLSQKKQQGPGVVTHAFTPT
jgi:hypothetical protein